MAISLVNDLLRSAISTALPAQVYVTGFSMTPFLYPQDLIYIQPCDYSSLQIGDIIVFDSFGQRYVHRVVGLLVQGVLTKGDNSRVFDPVVVKDYIIGKVCRRQRKQKVIDLTRLSWRIVSFMIGLISYVHGIVCLGLRYIKRKYERVN